MDLNRAQEILEPKRTCSHSFLTRMRTETLSDEQVRDFGIQWYKAATAHKRAFPGLIYNTPNDIVRFDLIHILRDEYGNGDVKSIHAFMLLRFLKSLGITEAEIAAEPIIPEIQDFSRIVDRTWLTDHPVLAFGVHYALEVLAAEMHLSFGRGLRTASNCSSFDFEYFDYHGVAEVEHADVSDRGLQIYCEDSNNHQLLEHGLKQGVALITLLWDGLERHVFDKKSIGQPGRHAA